MGQQAAVSGEPVFCLGEALEIGAVKSLHGELRALLQTGGPLMLDGSKVVHIDSATLQMLAALFACADHRGQMAVLRSPSTALVQRASLLGIAELIGIEERH